MSSILSGGLQSLSRGEIVEPSLSPRAPSASGEPDLKTESSRRDAAQLAKFAGRLNASKVSDAERDALLAERQKLLDKRLDGTISPADDARLQYVRWSLDRIDDALHGAELDKLEGFVNEFKRVAGQVQGLRDELQARTPQRRR